jgi:hypothetical protein
MHRFNIQQKSLKDHFKFNKFRWLIYHHHQGESSTPIAHSALSGWAVRRGLPQRVYSAYSAVCAFCKATLAVCTQQWRSSFRCELPPWWSWYIWYRNILELKLYFNDFLLYIKFVHYGWYFLVNNSIQCTVWTTMWNQYECHVHVVRASINTCLTQCLAQRWSADENYWLARASSYKHAHQLIDFHKALFKFTLW